jgi:hypothetical protein
VENCLQHAVCSQTHGIPEFVWMSVWRVESAGKLPRPGDGGDARASDGRRQLTVTTATFSLAGIVTLDAGQCLCDSLSEDLFLPTARVEANHVSVRGCETLGEGSKNAWSRAGAERQ